MRCGEIDVGALAAARDHLWAEAVVRFRAGEPWWLDDRDLINAAAVEQSARLQRDAWEERIRDWCETETITDDHGYGSRWQAESQAFLARPENRLCACGCGQPAQVVDHKHGRAGSLMWDQRHWQPMTRACNSRKAAESEGGFGNPKR